MSKDPLKLTVLEHIGDLPAEHWNSLRGHDNPFISHAFLCALEDSGSVSASRGWTPHHLLIRGCDDQLLAALPTYQKSHSYGEYVFDWAWAEAYHRHGLEYYPKLVSAIPFTPSVGPRLLLAAGADLPTIRSFLRQEIPRHCEQHDLSGWHLLFPDQASRLTDDGIEERHDSRDLLLVRQGTQFHWHNRNYQSFDDFLDGLTSRKRKNLRKERKRVAESGIRFQWYRHTEISRDVIEQFYVFYQMTYFKRGQAPYLTPEFFHRLRQTLPQQMKILLAYSDNRAVAGALFFQDSEALYGRYWGATEDFDQLHFECCYYQGIDEAIREGVALFDAGAQGEHKILRGFEPVATWSEHYIAHPAFRQAIADFVQQEQEGVNAYMEDAAGILPYRISS